LLSLDYSLSSSRHVYLVLLVHREY
jgi:hypothetical protein